MMKKNSLNKVKVSKELSTKLFKDKTKPIEKRDRQGERKSDYSQFYKSYYEKLRKEHSSWSSKEITSIVSLMWKRFKKLPTNMTETESKVLCDNIASGKEGFRNLKLKEGLNEEQLEDQWKRLPVESKKQW